MVLGEPDDEHPVAIPAEMVSLWSRENITSPATGSMRLYYIDPNGTQSTPISLGIDLSKAIYHRTRINLTGLLLTKKGLYSFIVEYQISGVEAWQMAANIPLLVLTQQLAQP